MAENTAISWTDATFNPWIGCSKVSVGCKFCYADRENNRYRWNPAGWGPQAPRKRTSPANWKKPLQWNREAEKAGVRKRVFCASLADVFDDHPSIEPTWRADLWNLIERTPHLDWLLLTKRPENIERFIPDRWDDYGYYRLHGKLSDGPPLPRNIWFGISAEDQANFDVRWFVFESAIHHLYPQVVFLSLEPLLSSINIQVALDEIDLGDEDRNYWTRPADWVITGGESGPNARPTHPDWVRSIRDQCQEANVPFHFKQWGEWALKGSVNSSSSDFGVLDPGGEFYRGHTGWNGRSIDPDTSEAYVIKVGKRAAGRILDGQVWDEFPRGE